MVPPKSKSSQLIPRWWIVPANPGSACQSYTFTELTRGALHTCRLSLQYIYIYIHTYTITIYIHKHTPKHNIYITVYVYAHAIPC